MGRIPVIIAVYATLSICLSGQWIAAKLGVTAVKDLVTGSALAFSERGSYELRGMPGSWRIFRVERQPA